MLVQMKFSGKEVVGGEGLKPTNALVVIYQQF